MEIALFLIGFALAGIPAAAALRRVVAARDAASAAREAAERELATARAELDVERRSFDAKLMNAVKAVSAEALNQNNDAFLALAETKLSGYVAPLKESLEKVDGQVRALEQARQSAFGALRNELQTLRDGQERLRSATGSLATALRTPHIRGRWGEVQLKRVVEATGMIEHCDFEAQVSTRDTDGSLLRPDLIVRLPGGKQVVVDAKVPLVAYLDAFEADDEGARRAHLADHARQLRDHIGKLGAKAYWRQFAPAPDFVVMFLPDETFLRAAQEHDPTIVEYAWQAHVIPASPTNLFALLRTVAATWQQETVAENARTISALGAELYERIGKLGSHVAKLGRCLDSAVGAYNDTVGSLESRVLVTGRKLQEYGMPGELPSVEPVETRVRPLTAPELAAPAAATTLPAADAA